jgi:hypothetical protein
VAKPAVDNLGLCAELLRTLPLQQLGVEGASDLSQAQLCVKKDPQLVLQHASLSADGEKALVGNRWRFLSKKLRESGRHRRSFGRKIPPHPWHPKQVYPYRLAAANPGQQAGDMGCLWRCWQQCRPLHIIAAPCSCAGRQAGGC